MKVYGKRFKIKLMPTMIDRCIAMSWAAASPFNDTPHEMAWKQIL